MTKTVSDVNNEFTVSEVHRPINAIFIEKILIENVVSHHKNFIISKRSEINFMAESKNNKTSKIIDAYLDNYNNQVDSEKKCKNKEVDDEKNYSNSPLQKTEKNEKEIEKYRKLRIRDGENYNKKNENKNENENEKNPEERSRNKSINERNDLNTISISLPLFLVSLSFCSLLSFFYGKNHFSK